MRPLSAGTRPGRCPSPLAEWITEVGLALNGERRQLLTLFRDPGVATHVVEHRDRFVGFSGESTTTRSGM
jgi:predicted site-specific integrase-resolvase